MRLSAKARPGGAAALRGVPTGLAAAEGCGATRASDLASLQRWFFAQLQPGARRQAGPVVATPGLSPKARVDIYANMYLARLTDALASEHPRFAARLGERRFAALARAYFARHPSEAPTIQHAGVKLPAFLRRHPVRGVPEAADLARLEQAASLAFTAKDADPRSRVTRAWLEALPSARWPRLRFGLDPSVQVLRLSHRFIQGKRAQRGVVWMRVFSRDFQILEAAMPTREARALRAVGERKTFADVCAIAGNPTLAAGWLATWVEEGLLIKRAQYQA